MRKWSFMFLALLGSTSAFAVLPPLAQSIREIQALCSDSNFYDKLGSGEQIKDILRVEEGYLVMTSNYAMLVHVKYDKEQKFVGPSQFHLEFQQPIDLSTVQPKGG